MLRLVVVLVATAVTSVAPAQTLPDTLVWERVGTINDMRGLFFDGDTLYASAIASTPIQVLRPGDPDWSQAFPANARAKDLLIMEDRTIFGLTAAASGLWRSIDWGETGEGVHESAKTLPVPTPEGALLLGPNEPEVVAARSTDGGATWIHHGFAPGTGIEDEALTPASIVVTPPSATLPAGRIVVGGTNGLAYSDDDGRSWLPTALYGGLAYIAWSTVRIAEVSHDVGSPGRILAVVERGAPGGEPTGLYASEDGGATWTRLGPIPGGGTFDTRLAAAPDGAVYAYLQRTDEAPVWRTTDGGQTWENLGPVWVKWPAEVSEITAGPDGRLYAACSGGGFSGFDGGVFRTTEAVVTVASESEALDSPRAELEAYPNPSSGSVTVVLTSSEAAEVTVAVFDVLGREVAVLHDGRLAAGTHRLAFDGAGLPAGVYLVRVESGSDHLTERITLLR